MHESSQYVESLGQPLEERFLPGHWNYDLCTCLDKLVWPPLQFGAVPTHLALPLSPPMTLQGLQVLEKGGDTRTPSRR